MKSLITSQLKQQKMSQNQGTTQADLLHTITNAEKNHTENKNSTLIKHIKIENTPFMITGDNERGYFLRMGDYRLTEFTPENEMQINFEGPNWENTPENKEYLIRCWFEEYILINQWNLTLTIIAAILHAQENGKGKIEIEKNNNNNNNNK